MSQRRFSYQDFARSSRPGKAGRLRRRGATLNDRPLSHSGSVACSAASQAAVHGTLFIWEDFAARPGSNPAREICTNLKIAPLALAALCAMGTLVAVPSQAQVPAVASDSSNEESRTAPSGNSSFSALPQVTHSETGDDEQNLSRRRVTAVQSLAENFIAELNTPAARIYLSNRSLADSSTFSYRLMNALSSRDWHPSPLLPVPRNDLTCYTAVPSYRALPPLDTENAPIQVEADNAQSQLSDQGGTLVYSGNVVVSSQGRTLNTQTLTYDSQTRTLATTGTSTLDTGEYTVHAEEPVQLKIDSHDFTLRQTRFRMNGSVLRGSAALHEVDQAHKTQHLEQATLTTCPDDRESWLLQANEIDIDQNDEDATLHGTVMRLHDVPVFYLPWAKVPITNTRRSGLLYTSLSFGSDSFKLYQPVYFNLAPNYDLTLTPKWAGHRHFQLDSEFRFMPVENIQGMLTMSYLPEDVEWKNEYGRDDGKRWFLNLSGTAWFLEHDLEVELDYSRVRPGDYSYLSDISQNHVSITDDHIRRYLTAQYTQDQYYLSVTMEKYTSMLPPQVVSYSMFSDLPRLKFGWADVLSGPLTGSFEAQFDRFEKENEAQFHSFTTQRLHFEPGLSYHLFDRRGASLDASVKGLYTHYRQGDLNSLPSTYRSYLGFDEAERDVNRTLYEIKVHGKATFERKALDMRHTQTLEPEVQYMYVPYRNQRHIALYDTTDRTEDLYSLFSTRKFSGLDRIADLNAISWGVTSRILDAHDREQLRVAVAQSYNFHPTKVTLNSSDVYTDYPRSPLSFTFDLSPSEALDLHAAATYQSSEHRLRSWNAYATYHKDKTYAQLYYRYYRNGNYVIKTQQPSDIRQAGVTLSAPLSNSWSFTVALNRDLEENYSIDWKAALRYDDCCYAVTFLAASYAEMDWYRMAHRDKHVFGVELTLKGLKSFSISGESKPMSADTHYLPAVNPVNMNR
ncbi:MAG: LPS assembly protein LptD [Succinivibrio sp.]|nr:LPS assembly protein LptD [Succinivibrio sp.]